MDRIVRVITQLCNEAGRTVSHAVRRESSLREDLGFDSLELAILTVKIEAEFGVDVFADGVVNTVGEILDKLGEQ